MGEKVNFGRGKTSTISSFQEPGPLIYCPESE